MIHYEGHGVQLHHGDCLDVLATLPDASVDSVVTDPPYGLEFMGKEWDSFRDTGSSSLLHSPKDEGRVFTNESGHMWDNTKALPRFPGAGRPFQAWCEAWATECLRVLKPGGHLLAFGGSRTYHRLTSGVEDAGFEIRDCITWHFGSGFPKSLDVSKAIDKRPGVMRHAEFAAHLLQRRAASGLSRSEVSERVVGTPSGACWNWEHHQFPEAKWWPALRDLLDLDDEKWGPVIAEAEREVVGDKAVTRIMRGSGDLVGGTVRSGSVDLTASATPDAQRWQGWGTALKPATEFVVVARKPLTGTVAQTVLEWGTGALNIDATRINTEETLTGGRLSNGYLLGGFATLDDLRAAAERDEWCPDKRKGSARAVLAYLEARIPVDPTPSSGRWPSNVVFDEHQAAVLDEMSGEATSGANPTRRGSDGDRQAYGTFNGQDDANPQRGVDIGGASRFFYVAKADASERPRVPKADADAPMFAERDTRCTKCGKQRVNVPGSMCVCPEPDFQPDPARAGFVSHPTVKPLALMRWLTRLVTPPGGTCLDPFAGSGTTVEACIVEGFKCIAVEKTDEYLPLVMARIHRRRDPVQAIRLGGGDLGLFDLVEEEPAKPSGRWPANAIFSTSQAEVLDELSGEQRDGTAVGRNRNGDEVANEILGARRKDTNDAGYGGEGGASRFFLVVPEGES